MQEKNATSNEVNAEGMAPEIQKELARVKEAALEGKLKTSYTKNVEEKAFPYDKGFNISLVSIMSAEDLKKYGKLFIESVPKDVELIIMVTVPNIRETEEKAILSTTKDNVKYLKWYYKQQSCETLKEKWLESDFDFARARNIAKEFATGKWIVSLDADEYISPRGWNIINKISTMAAKDNELGGFAMNVVSADNSTEGMKEAYVVQNSQIRMFRNEKNIDWIGACHEGISHNLQKSGYKSTFTKIIVEHYGYDNTDKKKLIEKAKRNFYLLIKQINLNNDINNYFEQMLIRTSNLLTKLEETQ